MLVLFDPTKPPISPVISIISAMANNYQPATQQRPLRQGEQLHTKAYTIDMDKNGLTYEGVPLIDKVMLDEALANETRH